jgi:hypothetical protein
MFKLFKKQPQQETKQPQQETGPFAGIERAITLMPDVYRTEPAFSDCLRLVAGRDPRAVESLISLTKLDGLYFSDQFWREVEDCASKLNLPDPAVYCNQQIERNARELSLKLQPGWTIARTGPSSYQMQMSQAVREARNEERRRKHNVPRLLRKDGFHMVQEGREGTLYYVDDGRLMEFYVELSGNPEYSIIIQFNDVNDYVLPTRVKLTDEEKKQLRADLQKWLDRKGTRALLG